MRTYEILVIYDSGLTEKIVCEDYSEFFTETNKFFNDGYSVQRINFPHTMIATCITKHAKLFNESEVD